MWLVGAHSLVTRVFDVGLHDDRFMPRRFLIDAQLLAHQCGGHERMRVIQGGSLDSWIGRQLQIVPIPRLRALNVVKQCQFGHGSALTCRHRLAAAD